METISSQTNIKVNKIFHQGWELTKKHFPIFLLIIFLIQGISTLPNMIYYNHWLDSYLTHGTTISDQEWIQMLIKNGELGSLVGQVFILGLLAFFATIYLYDVNYRMLYAAVQGKEVNMTAELKNAFHGYWSFLGTYIVYCMIVTAGLFCCVLPGIFLGIRYMFVPIIAANHPEISFRERFSYSWKMTEGHFWILLWFGIIVVGINILGLLCCCVGILFTTILSYMMLICIYQSLIPENLKAETHWTL